MPNMYLTDEYDDMKIIALHPYLASWISVTSKFPLFPLRVVVVGGCLFSPTEYEW